MRHLLVVSGIVLLFFVHNLSAQPNPDAGKENVHQILNDSGLHAIRGRDRVITVDKANKLGLESLLGLSRAHAMAIISHFDHTMVREHADYPYIQDILEITKFKRWDFPITVYIFIDSSDQVCRISYKIGSENGIAETDARTILNQLHKEQSGLNVVRDSAVEVAGWEESDRFFFFTWEKEVPTVKPTYLVTLKTYVEEHLLPYLKVRQIPEDDLFTPIPSWMLNDGK